MDLGLGGKVAIVTGASRGIGAAIAQELGRQGCSVMLTARDNDALRTCAAQFDDAAKVDSRAGDLREAGMPAMLVSATLARFGRIDIVVANAGATKRGHFLQLTEEDWEDGFALKFFAHVRLIRAAWLHLKDSHGCVVIIAGAGAALADFSIGGSVNTALLGLTKSLADQAVDDGIRVNAINPGNIRTGRFARRLKAYADALGVGEAEAERRMSAADRTTRIGETADIARLVGIIASRQVDFLHGAIIDIDGGMTKAI